MNYIENFVYKWNAFNAKTAAQFTVDLQECIEDALQRPNDLWCIYEFPYYPKGDYIIEQYYVLQQFFKRQNVEFLVQRRKLVKLDNGTTIKIWEDFPFSSSDKNIRLFCKITHHVVTDNLIDL